VLVQRDGVLETLFEKDFKLEADLAKLKDMQINDEKNCRLALN